MYVLLVDVLLVDLCYMTEILNYQSAQNDETLSNQSIILLVDVCTMYVFCIMKYTCIKVSSPYCPMYICKQNATKFTYIKRHFTVFNCLVLFAKNIVLP